VVPPKYQAGEYVYR